jgi:hypothetical protein
VNNCPRLGILLHRRNLAAAKGILIFCRAISDSLVFVDCQLAIEEGKMKGSTKPRRMDEPFSM